MDKSYNCCFLIDKEDKIIALNLGINASSSEHHLGIAPLAELLGLRVPNTDCYGLEPYTIDPVKFRECVFASMSNKITMLLIAAKEYNDKVIEEIQGKHISLNNFISGLKLTPKVTVNKKGKSQKKGYYPVAAAWDPASIGVLVNDKKHQQRLFDIIDAGKTGDLALLNVSLTGMEEPELMLVIKSNADALDKALRVIHQDMFKLLEEVKNFKEYEQARELDCVKAIFPAWLNDVTNKDEALDLIKTKQVTRTEYPVQFTIKFNNDKVKHLVVEELRELITENDHV